MRLACVYSTQLGRTASQLQPLLHLHDKMGYLLEMCATPSATSCSSYAGSCC